MTRLLCLALLLLFGRAEAAPAPPSFVAYHSPAPICDVRPVTAQCAATERQRWRAFLDHKLPDFPHVSSVRLVDVFFKNAIRGGWVFEIVTPTAPQRWQTLAITVGGIAIGVTTADNPDARHVRHGALVVEVVIERVALAPGKHRIEAHDGSEPVFAVDVVLENGAADTPDLTKALADDAAAAKRAPFLVATLPTKPACNVQPKPAGCNRATAAMWSALFTNTLAGHPHATQFAKRSRPDAAGQPIWHWGFHLVFPTSPANWLHRDLEILIDGKPAPYSHRHKQIGTEALLVELTFLEGHEAPGKHELRAVGRATGSTLFTTQVELIK